MNHVHFDSTFHDLYLGMDQKLFCDHSSDLHNFKVISFNLVIYLSNLSYTYYLTYTYTYIFQFNILRLD